MQKPDMHRLKRNSLWPCLHAESFMTHLWSQSDHRNWLQAFDHHHEEATSCCPSTLTENASSASAVWPTVCLQEGKRAFPCWHPLKSIPGWTPRRDRIWVWCHDSAVHLSRQDDRDSVINSGRCNHAEAGKVHQGRLAWTWVKCSTWRKTLLSFPWQACDWKWRHPERTKGSVAQIFAVDIHRHLTQGPHECGPHHTACQRWSLLAKDATRHQECCFSAFCMQQLQSPSPEATPHQSPRPWPSLGNCWSRHFWLEPPPVPGHSCFLLWLVRDGFTAWQLLKDNDLQDEAPVFDSWHSREDADRQWQAVRQPWIWAVCQGMEICTHYKQPILCTVKRLGWKRCQASKTAGGEMQKRWVWCSVGSPEPAEHTKRWHGFSSPVSALQMHPHHSPTSMKLLKPKPLSTSRVSTQLKKVRQQQKQYHNKSARHQRPLKPNEVVRMQTDKGFQRLAVVKSSRDRPRSYIVTSDGADYVRNRRHLLPVSEPRPQNSQQDSYATSLQHPSVGDGTPTTEDQKQQTVPLPFMATCPSPPSTLEQTCGYSAWLSTAFTCTTMFLGVWPDVSYTRAYCSSMPGATKLSACSDTLWASCQTRSKILDLVPTHKHAHIHSHSQT